MTHISILLALIIERVLNQFPCWGQPWLFLRIMRGLQRLSPVWLWRSPLPPLLVVLVPTALVWHCVEQIEGPIVELLVSAALLLLCLGPRDLSGLIRKLMRARDQGDSARVAQLSRALQRGPHPGHTHHSFIGALFIQSHEKMFGVLLWFFVLGPAGAVAYRLVGRIPRYFHDTAADSWALVTADALHNAMAWLPARATALAFSLAGSLDDGLAAWRRLWREPEHAWRTQTWAVLAEVSAAALGARTADGAPVVPASLDAMMREVLRMQARALLIILASFVLLTTGSYL
ncbi:regulatory signaling modulator protein AmpE [Sinimarinibacterium sp. NLF-5-8]|uniref:regulatory signaling modulator protein AmpE n=1 Tax=Sinimarinibacterium sp. NLF-5-8 TaxID=2698684 RepID=UPI00137C0FFB|nr:regulatory signaling modulator protein AmpE [Sinimarinibacterium sp. NLF-5-8]QHS10479.1 regulatory signaling modulator protein AmpE [Sinimarinibacterium sp. NLF-5-8]